MFNRDVDKMSIYLDNILKVNREYLLRNNDLLNFKDYFNVNFNTDAENNIYPDVKKLGAEIPSGGEKKKENSKDMLKGGKPFDLKKGKF